MASVSVSTGYSCGEALPINLGLSITNLKVDSLSDASHFSFLATLTHMSSGAVSEMKAYLWFAHIL